MCPTKLLISPSPPKISISPRKTESWVEACFIGKNHIFLHSKWAFNDSQLLKQSDQLKNLSEEHHDLSCFYLDSHWDNGESLLAYPTKDVVCSSWVCSSLGVTGLPCLLSMAPFWKAKFSHGLGTGECVVWTLRYQWVQSPGRALGSWLLKQLKRSKKWIPQAVHGWA